MTSTTTAAPTFPERPLVRVGIVGGGLMGREVASALGRWFALDDPPVRAELTAVCDPVGSARDWFRRVPTVRHLCADHRELLAAAGPDQVDVVYVAVPHDQHERIYLDVLAAGRDLLAEKPFGIDRRAARAVREAAAGAGRFVRASSEFPFFPGAWRAYQLARTPGWFGRLLEVRAGLLHASDLDPHKPANWKRLARHCGEIGVMGDLGLHALHLPLRLGWKPQRVYAQLQRGYPVRPDGRGGQVACDTWDNATLHGEWTPPGEADPVPLRLELKRLAPGETNTWYFEALGTDGAVRFSSKEPKTLWLFRRDGPDPGWRRLDLGHQTPFPTVTGGIFEVGFPDVILQMWAAFLAERAGALGDRLGCVTPDEAVASHEVFAAALESRRTGAAATVG